MQFQSISGKNTDDFTTNSQKGRQISRMEARMTSSSSEAALPLSGNFYFVYQNCFRRLLSLAELILMSVETCTPIYHLQKVLVSRKEIILKPRIKNKQTNKTTIGTFDNNG